MKITDIRLEHLRLDLDPPFNAAWDPEPRRAFDATLVRVDTDAGVTGIGSGDTMGGFGAYRDVFIGTDPTRISAQVRRIESCAFHGGRFWPLEAALWDIIGQVAGLPVATLLGGEADRLPAYMSTGELRSPEQRRDVTLAAAEEGFRAVKIRIDRGDVATGVRCVREVRDALGDEFAIMVDLNQSWRMAGDIAPTLPPAKVRRLADQLADLRVEWLEEPLPYADSNGLRDLRRHSRVAIAGGEMLPSMDAVRDYLRDDVLDIYQMDAVLAIGLHRGRLAAEWAAAQNRRFTPHSWTNGVGVLANLHLAAGVGAGPYFEFPYDPDGWTVERRDFMLAEPVLINASGEVEVPRRPGLGVVVDEDRVAALRVDA